MPLEFNCISGYDIENQRKFSTDTFGPGDREAGVLDHIRKELIEIEEADIPDRKLGEFVDVLILAIDGAWRAGFAGWDVIEAYHAKMARNKARTWPDWRTAEVGKAIEHVRGGDGD